MSGSLDRLPRASRHRRAHRVAAVLLALPLAGIVTTIAPSAAHDRPATSGVSIPVGGLTYSSGAGSETWGLRNHSAWSSRVVKHRYAVRKVYGYRSSNTSDHGKRLAADFMVYSKSAKGNKIRKFAKKHHRQLNITYIIWNQRIWSVPRASEGWRRMTDGGSRTANHLNHVHVSFRKSPNNDTYSRS